MTQRMTTFVIVLLVAILLSYMVTTYTLIEMIKTQNAIYRSTFAIERSIDLIEKKIEWNAP
jgi:low affinity Fe/Cu permease